MSLGEHGTYGFNKAPLVLIDRMQVFDDSAVELPTETITVPR